MLSFEKKILYLETLLSSVSTPYRDGLKTDILIYLGEFNTENPELKFLKKFNNKAEINLWLENLLSHIVLKYDEESKQLSCFISEYTLITDKELEIFRRRLFLEKLDKTNRMLKEENET